ncbi:glycine--tRNA ligase subunit beta [Atopobacter sp. AH10]|uniref:glycine--tRNA ligase subunit beta n=1 Tax=Atopobacter sp. AH10 TaxID=2315861 RepID=UPI000EF1F5A8|nr:glycine--tRNA ligase subunit beta [Atopobacter sp. AH10]RLK62501.1 glycine--tRNA ligase subunit beta [Atopobacter sp. AH10]
MHQFLLECGLEEMPSSVIVPAMEQLDQLVRQTLDDEGVQFESIEHFSTPRRLAIRINGLPDRQKDKVVKHKGPSYRIAYQEGQGWTKAAQGFVRGKGASLEDIIVEKVGDEDYIFVEEKIEGKSIESIVSHFAELIEKIKYPVSMHWGTHTYEYIRPVHWLVALLDDQVIPMQVFDIQSDRKTRGHRFFGHEVSLNHSKDYEELLRDQHVIADRAERQLMIRQQLSQLTEEKGMRLEEDQELLDEVTDLVEYPQAIMGDFSDKYLRIPDEVLITTMKDHQRFFAVRDQKGALLPHFVTFANGSKVSIDLVRKGNEKVLVARLEDALFFYQEDMNKSIDFFNQGLEKLLVHRLIGTMAEKQVRVSSLVESFSKQVNLSGEEQDKLKRAASIYKFDLISQTVQELPELQGKIGGDLALYFGEDPLVALSIREQYLPTGASSQLPSHAVSAALAFLDKLDSIITFFKAGLKPSSSNDPYGLRRQANGMVDILIDQRWSIDWNELFLNMAELYHLSDEEVEEVFHFLLDRLAYKLGDQGVRDDVIAAVKEAHPTDFVRMYEAAHALQNDFIKEEFKVIVENLSRVSRLLKKTEEEGKKIGEVNPSLFESKSEASLNKYLLEFKASDLSSDYRSLWTLAPIIQSFFEENMIMVDNQEVQANRLGLLKNCRQLIKRIGDFSLLQVKR